VAFATIDELASYTGVSIDPAQGALLLDLATSSIQEAAGQQILLVTDDQVTLKGNWSRRINLPQRPVVDVSQVVLSSGTALTDSDVAGPDSLTLQAGEDYLWQRSGTMWRPRGFTVTTEHTFDTGVWANWGGPDMEVNVIYSHGLDPAPDWVKGICLEAAKRVVVNPSGVQREAIDGYSVVFDRNLPAGVTLTQSEIDQLTRQFKKKTWTGQVSGM